MRRTEKKLKSKFGRTCKFHWIECCPSLMKYDRKYVARHHGDVRHLPFSRGNDGDWDASFFQWVVRNYIERFLFKRVGMDADMVFHQFCRLGWANTYDMYDMWSLNVGPKYRFYVSEEGILMDKTLDDADGQPEEDEEYESLFSKRRPKSKVKAPCIWCRKHSHRKSIYVDRKSKFNVENVTKTCAPWPRLRKRADH